jgi:hypothetical protein
MARKAKASRPSQADQAAEEAAYAAWKLAAVAGLASRHDVKAGTIPERLWKKLYSEGRSPQGAADRAAVSAHNVRSAADRLKRR